jgi:hypothetical protein
MAGFRALVADAGGRGALAGRSTQWLKHNFVLPATEAARQSYAEVLCARAGEEAQALVGRATAFLSHAYDYRVLDLIDAAEAWELRNPRQGSGAHYFYYDLCVVSQHSQSAIVPFDVLRNEFGRSVRGIGRTLFLLDFDAPISLSRAWCVFEAATALAFGVPFEIIMPPRDAQAFALALETQTDTLVTKTCAIDVERATAREAEDEANIKRLVRESLGGFLSVNQLVTGAMRRWMAGEGSAALRALPQPQRAASVLQRVLSRLLADQGDLQGAQGLMEEALSACAAAEGGVARTR